MSDDAQDEPLEPGPLDIRAADLLRAGISSDEIIGRLTDEGIPQGQAESIGRRAVRSVIRPEAIRLFRSGLSIMRVGGLLLVGVGALMLRVIFWVDWFRR